LPFAFVSVLFCLSGCHNDSVRDIDGNSYKTIAIGTQVWMAENLKTTRYADGTPIPVVEKYDEWLALTTPAYALYNNDASNLDVYGALYNWHAVQSGKLCPKGWHVPDNADWTTLIIYLGGSNVAGNDMKEAGSAHWKSPNFGATNVSGFTALPGGFRSSNGSFNYLGISAYWWTSSEFSPANAYYLSMSFRQGFVFKNISMKSSGYCVRCIMDAPAEPK
jgi:uncharacterized protein (TIGR02145 family)